MSKERHSEGIVAETKIDLPRAAAPHGQRCEFLASPSYFTEGPILHSTNE